MELPWQQLTPTRPLIPLSAFREISISGRAVDQSYSAQNSSSGLGVFDQSLSDSAVGTDSEGTTYTAISQVSPTSSLSNDQISLRQDIDVNGFMLWTYPASLRGNVVARATSLFEYTFLLDEPSRFDLSAAGFLSGPHAGSPEPPDFQVQLSSPSGFLLDTLRGRSLVSFPQTFDGVLPDTYTLRVFYDASTYPDPLGDSEFAHFNLGLKSTSVPETGSTLLLLFGGFAVLLVTPFQYRVQRAARLGR